MSNKRKPKCGECADESCGRFGKWVWQGALPPTDCFVPRPPPAPPSPEVVERVAAAILGAMLTEDGSEMVTHVQVSAAARAAIKAMGREVGP